MNPGATAAESFFHFLPRGHARVAGRGRGKRAVRRAVFDGLLRVVEFEETKLQAAGETVAATDAVEDFQAGILAAFVELAVVPEDRAPVVLCRGDDVAQRGRGHLKFGNSFTAVSIIALNASIITSTYFAISRFTSCAFLRPPMDFQSDGR